MSSRNNDAQSLLRSSAAPAPPPPPPLPNAPAFGPGSKWNNMYQLDNGHSELSTNDGDEINSTSSYDDDSLAPPSSRDTTPSPSPSSASVQPMAVNGQENSLTAKFTQKQHYVSSLSSDTDVSPTPSSSSSSARTPVVLEITADDDDGPAAEQEVIEVNSSKYGLDKVVEEPEYESDIDAGVKKTTAQVEEEEFVALDSNCVAMSQRYELGNDGDDDEEPNNISSVGVSGGEQNAITIVDATGRKRVISIGEYERMDEEERDQYIVVAGEDSDGDDETDGQRLVVFPTEVERLAQTTIKSDVKPELQSPGELQSHNTIETLCKSLLTTVANVVLPHVGLTAEPQQQNRTSTSITTASSDSGKPLTPPALLQSVSELQQQQPPTFGKKGPLVTNAAQQLMEIRNHAREAAAQEHQQQAHVAAEDDEDENDDDVKSENSSSAASCTSPATMLTQQQQTLSNTATAPSSVAQQVGVQQNSANSLTSTPTPTPDVPSTTPTSAQDLYSSAALVALPPPALPTATSMLAAKAGLVKQLVIQQQKQQAAGSVLPQQQAPKSPHIVNGTVFNRKQAYQRQETPIEQEIRLAKEREDQHRYEHGLAAPPASGIIVPQQQQPESPKLAPILSSTPTVQPAITAARIKSVLSHRSSLESPLVNSFTASTATNNQHPTQQQQQQQQARPFSIAEVYNSAATARNNGSAIHHHHQHPASTIPPNSPNSPSASGGGDTQRQWATNRIRREIEEQQMRENELKHQYTPNNNVATPQSSLDGESPQQLGNTNKFQFGNASTVAAAIQREKPENIAPPVGVREAARSFESMKPSDISANGKKKPFAGGSFHKSAAGVNEHKPTFNGGTYSPLSSMSPTTPTSSPSIRTSSAKSPFSNGGAAGIPVARQLSGSAALAAAINRGVYQQQQNGGGSAPVTTNGSNGVAGDSSLPGNNNNFAAVKNNNSQKMTAQSLIEKELVELQQREDELRRERGLPPIYSNASSDTNNEQPSVSAQNMTSGNEVTGTVVVAACASLPGGVSHSARNGSKIAVHSSSVAPSRELFRQWEQKGQ